MVRELKTRKCTYRWSFTGNLVRFGTETAGKWRAFYIGPLMIVRFGYRW